jgi:hypothetical protein
MDNLKKAFNFDEADIAANRQGIATSAQIERLKAKGRRPFGLVVFSSLSSLILPVFSIMFLFLVFIVAPPEAVNLVVFPMLKVIGLFCAVSLLFSFVRIIFVYQKKHDAREKRVASRSGNFSRRTIHESVYNKLIVSGLTFKITLKESRALRPYLGKQIAVYYFPRSRQIASVEILP